MITEKLHDPTRRPLATLLRNPALYQRWLERRFPNTSAHPTLPATFPEENGVLLEPGRGRPLGWRSCGAAGCRSTSSRPRTGTRSPRSARCSGRTGTAGRVLDAGRDHGVGHLVVAVALRLSRPLVHQPGVPRARSATAGSTTSPATRPETRFDPETFDVVTCLSVVEHGVDLDGYFREAARILKPGGALVTSTDYYPDPIDTAGKHAYGVPVKIFNRAEIERHSSSRPATGCSRVLPYRSMRSTSRCTGSSPISTTRSSSSRSSRASSTRDGRGRTFSRASRRRSRSADGTRPASAVRR